MTNPTRTRQTTTAREDVRTPTNLGRGVAIGRDGQPLRRVKVGSDKYYVRPELIPDGWVYQWKRHTILGQEDPQYMAEVYRAGWRPVPAERHPGEWGPKDQKGSVLIGGQMLMERPVELDEEAQAEQRFLASQQVNGSREQFGFAPTASGFEGANTSRNPAVRANSFARSSIERVDAPSPKHEIAIDE